MTPRDFCYWLQGYFEMTGEGRLTFEQADIIQQHLALVFDQVSGKSDVTEKVKVAEVPDPPEITPELLKKIGEEIAKSWSRKSPTRYCHGGKLIC